MTKRAKLDIKRASNLFQKTEPPDAGVDPGHPSPDQAPEPAIASSPGPTSASTAVPSPVHVPPKKRYELLKLTALGGKWVYLSQMTDPERIRVLVEEFMKMHASKAALKENLSSNGVPGVYILGDFKGGLNPGEAFRWFARRLCHDGWEPFAADQSPPDTPAGSYRDTLFFRFEQAIEMGEEN